VSRTGNGRRTVVLVTGGEGFIGSHIVDALVAEGRTVRSFDLLHPLAHGEQPAWRNPGAEYVRGDVCDPAGVEAALDGVGAVCHQAAMVGLGTDFGDVADYARHNDLGTAALLLALHRTGFAGRLVLASSMVVYGEGRYSCLRHGVVPAPARAPEALDAGRFEPACPACGGDLRSEAVPEEAPLEPRNVYAATKVHQEHLCTVYGHAAGVPVTALRYHNVYGPRMPRDTPYAGVASIFLSALTAGRAPAVFEDGGQRRDFVHVRDVARANVLALTGPPVPGAFNVASGEPRTVGDMAAALAEAVGGPEPEVTGAWRPGDVRHVVASPARATAALGFRAGVAFADGMRELARGAMRAPARSSHAPAGGRSP
jgi:dTDP-L-rhamnose 4-epimerase